MNSSFISVAFFDNTDPDTMGWLVLALWFVLFVIILNTIIFTLRRLFRRWRSSKAGSKVRHGEKQT
jgi:threonine/homoserine/homoserine lactone efflux protein